MSDTPPLEALVLDDKRQLKGGENSDQRADASNFSTAKLVPVQINGETLYRLEEETPLPSILDARDMGKQVRTFGTTNLMDIGTDWRTLAHMNERYNMGGQRAHIFCASKHGNLVVLAKGDTQLQAVKRALAADPNSPFGGIVGFNQPLEYETAKFIDKMFIEGVIAPDYDGRAVELLTASDVVKAHENRFILQMRIPRIGEIDGPMKHRFIGNALHRQEPFNYQYDLANRACIVAGIYSESPTDVAPAHRLEPAVLLAAQFGVNAMALISSNTILFSTEHAIVGVGNGQGNRYFAARNARASMEESLYAARNNSAQIIRALDGTPFSVDDFEEVMSEPFTLAACSDAFFPQPDALIETTGLDRVSPLFVGGRLKLDYRTRKGETKKLDMQLKRDNFALHENQPYNSELIPRVVVQPGICLGDAKNIAIMDAVYVPMVFMVTLPDYLTHVTGGKSPTGKRWFSHPAYE